MERLKKIAAIAATAAIVAVVPAGSAVAKIEPVCTNPGGNEPAGQQDKCQGQALEEENRNPAGKAPPGHNK